MDRQPIKNRFQAIIRPLALLLVIGICLGGTMLYQADDPTGSLTVLVYHDLNGNGVWETTDRNPSEAVKLGFSGISGTGGTYTLETIPPTQNNSNNEQNSVHMKDIVAGTYQLTSLTGVDTLYQYDLQVMYANGTTIPYSSADVHAGKAVFQIYPDNSSTQTNPTKIYVRMLYKQPDGNITGRITFPNGRPEGIQAQLGTSGGTVSAAVGSDGGYSFPNLSPGAYQITIDAPDIEGVRHLMEPASRSVTLLDGGKSNGNDFTLTRITDATYWMGATQVAKAENVVIGNKLSEPVISSQHLQFSNGRHIINGWYTDQALTQPWDFDNSTISGPTNLYASWRTVYDLSGSGTTSSSNSSRGNSRQDSPTRPVIKQATATVEGASVKLDVEMDSFFDLFDYQWLVEDDNGYWMPFEGGNQASVVYKDIKPDKTYSFKAVVNLSTNGAQAESQIVTARISSSSGRDDVSAPDGNTPPPAPTSTGGGGSAPVLRRVDSNIVYAGGRLEVDTNTSGGIWIWDSQYFSGEIQESGSIVLTALQDGDSEVEYILNGRTGSLTVEILPSSLPAVGQDITPVLVLAGSGMSLLALAAILWLRRTGRKEARHG